MPNKINQLLDKDFIAKYFIDNILSKYPDCLEIIDIEIIPRKNIIWSNSYHVVIEYQTTLKKPDGIETVPIFCTAHDSEPRKKVFTNLEFLWNNGFGNGDLSIPRPLFYSLDFNATFYQGINGHNLYYYIKLKDDNIIASAVEKSALWLAKLHGITTEKLTNFNDDMSLIKNVVPGVNQILKRIEQNYPELHPVFQKIYTILIANEENTLEALSRRWIVHGDAHPENIIIKENDKIAVIDFTDLCLTDFARDLGTFLQQLDYMIMKKINDQNYADKIKKLFLDKYCEYSGIKLDDDLNKRIKNYYYWTEMRTAAFFLMKHEPQPERATPLIDEVKKNLNI